MFQYLLTGICDINRVYQRNKKDLYALLLSSPKEIMLDIFSIMHCIQH